MRYNKRKDPIWMDAYESGQYLKAFASNYVKRELNDFVYIVYETTNLPHWKYGQVDVVNTKDNRVINSYKPYSMYAAYSLFNSVTDAASYAFLIMQHKSKCWYNILIDNEVVDVVYYYVNSKEELKKSLINNDNFPTNIKVNIRRRKNLQQK